MAATLAELRQSLETFTATNAFYVPGPENMFGQAKFKCPFTYIHIYIVSIWIFRASATPTPRKPALKAMQMSESSLVFMIFTICANFKTQKQISENKSEAKINF